MLLAGLLRKSGVVFFGVEGVGGNSSFIMGYGDACMHGSAFERVHLRSFTYV